ncbi:unnamed protein product [Coffea canephora]|uniref:Uncharacterized protein n=1 Tax=Coffea canephora TaxID=49390 RepID=A0A068U670_COFCA|nr:unnamed protein product [Coffea canephora]
MPSEIQIMRLVNLNLFAIITGQRIRLPELEDRIWLRHIPEEGLSSAILPSTALLMGCVADLHVFHDFSFPNRTLMQHRLVVLDG